MALALDDRVKETSTTTGTGTLNLSGAVSGFQTFVAGVGDGNTTYYAIVNRDEAEWEVGLGTVTDASTDTLARTTVISSSNSDSATSFSAGTKDVFVTLPASKVANLDTNDNLTIGSGSAGVDYTLTFDGADADGVLTWMEDEDYFKFSDDILINSTERLNFRDTALYIYSSTDGQLDLIADTEIQIAATTIDINGAVALNGAITGATDITLSGELDAATLDISGNADIDGTTNLDAVDIDGAVQIDATFTSGVDGQGYDTKFFGDTSSAYMLWDTSADDLILSGGAGLIVPDGQFTLGSTAVSSTAAEINLIDGGTSRGTTAIADGDGILHNDNGTMRMTSVETFSTYFASETTGGSGIVTVGALDSGSITSGFGAIDNGTSGIRTDTFTAETSIIPDASGGADLGSASAEWGDFYIADDKYIQFGSDQNILVGYDETTTDTLKIAATEGAGLAITLMADEGDDAGDEWKLNVADGGTITLGNDIASAGTFVTHLTLTPNSTVASSLANFAGEVQMVTLDIGGTNVTTTAAEINLIDGGTSRGTTAVASGDGILINDAGTMAMTNVDTVSTYFASHNVGGGNIVTTGALDSGSITSGFGTIDTGSSTITTTGLISGGSLDIDNVLINGTTIGHTDDTDLLTLADGALTALGTITVGVDDAGHDVKLFGNAAGAYFEWDASADELRIMGASADATTSTGKLLLATSLTDINANDVIGKIDFQAPHEAGGTDAITVAASIQAIAQATFSSSVNATDLIFYTGHSEAAAEKIRFTSQNEIGIGGANYGTDGQVLTSAGAGAAVAWEDAGGGAVTALNSATESELVTVGSTTTELDAEANLTFTGSALTCIGTITTGVDDTGHDVKFFGATSGSYMLWDESADSLLLPAGRIMLGSGAVQAGTPNLTMYAAGAMFFMGRQSSDGHIGSFLNTSGSVVGRIDIDSSSTTYATSSDYRLKENETAITDGIDRVKQLKPYRFNFTYDPSKTKDGFFAHEAQEVVPEAVTGVKDETEDRLNVVLDKDGVFLGKNISEEDWEKGKLDETYPSDSTWIASKNYIVAQGIDEGKLIPLLTATIKDLITKVETLEAKVAVLEG